MPPDPCGLIFFAVTATALSVDVFANGVAVNMHVLQPKPRTLA